MAATEPSTHIVLPINAGSDGDSSRWPQRGLRHEDPMLYRVKLATKWARERGQSQEGMYQRAIFLPNVELHTYFHALR